MPLQGVACKRGGGRGWCGCGEDSWWRSTHEGGGSSCADAYRGPGRRRGITREDGGGRTMVPPSARCRVLSLLPAGWLLLALSVSFLLWGQAGARVIGCTGFGAVADSEADLEQFSKGGRVDVSELEFTEEECSAFREFFSRPAFPRNGERRNEALIWHQNRTDYGGDEACSGSGWLLSGNPPTCHCFHEASGDQCQGESDRGNRAVEGAVVYLLYGNDTRYYDHLWRSLESLQSSFLDQFPYPVVVFHSPFFAREPAPPGEGGKPRGSLLDALRPLVADNVRLIFEEVTIDYRDSLRGEFEASPPTGGGCAGTEYPVNYLHMGRFFEHAIFRHPRILEFDYIWRIDADLELAMGVPCDVFEVMRRSHAVFGYYYYSDWEDDRCGVHEGRQATESYAALGGFEPNHLQLMPIRSAYIGLWNILEVRFWTSDKALAFGEYVDEKGLAYTNRMGEQVFYALATSLLVSPAALHQYAGLGPFRHRGHEIIMGKREVNGVNVIADDVFCPEASEWDCNDFFECRERVPDTQSADTHSHHDQGDEL